MSNKVRLYPANEKRSINKDMLLFWAFVFVFALIFGIIGTATVHYPSINGVV